MNLLSLAAALMTASASVGTGSLKMDHQQNKMMDVDFLYQSNEVEKISDLVIGNIYRFSFNSQNDLGFDQGDYISIKMLKINSVDLDSLTLDYSDSYAYVEDAYDFNGYLNIDGESIMFMLPYSYATDGLSELSYLKNGQFTIDVIGVLDDYFFGHGDETLITGNPIQYTDYNVIVPSSSHRGNLYTTIYDFFYGIFDTSDTNELSMNIMGHNMNLTSWLAHTVTIALLLLGVLWLILVIRWIFRVFSGLVKI